MIALNDLLFAVTLFTALGAGLMAGIFFAFSVFIMKALARLSAHEGIAAMQSINIAIINPLFLTVFLGTAITSIVEVILSLLQWQEPGAVYLLVGGVFYFVGSVVVTVVFNVPRNEALAKVVPGDPKAASVWTNYLAKWTAWNHVRAIAALAATAAFIIALCN